VSLSQVVFLFCAYLGLATIKHAKSKLSLVKFFPYFPDAAAKYGSFPGIFAVFGHAADAAMLDTGLDS